MYSSDVAFENLKDAYYVSRSKQPGSIIRASYIGIHWGSLSEFCLVLVFEVTQGFAKFQYPCFRDEHAPGV